MYQPEQPVFDQAIESNIEITYGIEDVPKPWWKSLYFAVQITLVDFTPLCMGRYVCLPGRSGCCHRSAHHDQRMLPGHGYLHTDPNYHW